MRTPLPRLLRLTALTLLCLPACGDDDPPPGGSAGTAFTPSWSTAFGGSGEDVALDAVALADGLIIGGSFSGTVSFGADTLSSHGGVNPDGFVSSLDAAGVPVWTRRLGGANTERVTRVAAAADGTVFAAAEFANTIDVDGVVLATAGQMDVLLVAFDADDGSTLWYRQLGATGGIYAGDLGWRDGQVLLAGRFSGSVDFSGVLLSATAGSDAFLTAHDAGSGNRSWTRPYGGSGDEAATRLFTAGGGAPILAGTFDATLSLGGTDYTTVGDDDIFLAALVPTDGSVSWSVSFGGEGSDRVDDMAQADPANLWLAGRIAENADFGGVAATSTGGTDAYLAKLRTLGEVEWVKTLGGAGSDGAIGVAIDPGGYVLTAGTVSGAVDLGLGPTAGPTTPEFYASAYADHLGEISWAQRFAGDLNPVRLVTQDRNRFYVIGSVRGSATVGQDVVDSAGNADVWVTALDWLALAAPH